MAFSSSTQSQRMCTREKESDSNRKELYCISQLKSFAEKKKQIVEKKKKGGNYFPGKKDKNRFEQVHAEIETQESADPGEKMSPRLDAGRNLSARLIPSPKFVKQFRKGKLYPPQLTEKLLYRP